MAQILAMQNQQVLVEMSGEVVLNPDKHLALTNLVDVEDPECHSFGCFSWRFVRLSILIQLFWHLAKFLLSIYFEQEAVEGKPPWTRNLLAALSWTLGGNVICVEMWANSMAGERANANLLFVGNAVAAVAILAVAPVQVAEFGLCIWGAVAVFLTAPFLHYYNTRSDHLKREFLPHLLWTVAQMSGTVGCFVIMGAVGLTYAMLLSSGWTVAASIFLPFGTAIGETGMVIATRIMYDKFVHSKRAGKGNDIPIVGDQVYISAVCLIFSAHGFAEATRLSATLSGAIAGGKFSWIPTTMLSLLLNLSARLGWTRFLLIQTSKKLFGGPVAMKYFAPTGWSKLHDEFKIYAGYFRFCSVVAICGARAINYRQLGFDTPQAATFNLSATLVIISLLFTEVVEDEIVCRELLPVNPAGPGLLKVNLQGENGDPSQLLALEYVSNVPADPWKMTELGDSGRRLSTVSSPNRRASVSSIGSSVSKTISLGPREGYIWARLRGWFGQPRVLNPAPSLHGLRELPFVCQLSFISIVCEFTSGLLSLLVGAGYMRGICPSPLEGTDRIWGLIWWDVPLPC